MIQKNTHHALDHTFFLDDQRAGMTFPNIPELDTIMANPPPKKQLWRMQQISANNTKAILETIH